MCAIMHVCRLLLIFILRHIFLVSVVVGTYVVVCDVERDCSETKYRKKYCFVVFFRHHLDLMCLLFFSRIFVILFVQFFFASLSWHGAEYLESIIIISNFDKTSKRKLKITYVYVIEVMKITGCNQGPVDRVNVTQIWIFLNSDGTSHDLCQADQSNFLKTRIFKWLETRICCHRKSQRGAWLYMQ